jgi:predicted metalloprotease
MWWTALSRTFRIAGDPLDIQDYRKLKKKISFNLQEQKIIEKLQIPPESFIPLLFSLKYGGDWSFKTDSLEALAIKEKITRYDKKKLTGYTLENVLLFLNPEIIKMEGKVLRLEKCSTNKERELVERPFKFVIDAEEIVKAVLNPLTMEIIMKKIEGPLQLEGSTAYGVSHEMDHLRGSRADTKALWEFKYKWEEYKEQKDLH